MHRAAIGREALKPQRSSPRGAGAEASKQGSAQTWLMFISHKGNHLLSSLPSRCAAITQMLIGRGADVLCNNHEPLKVEIYGFSLANVDDRLVIIVPLTVHVH